MTLFTIIGLCGVATVLAAYGMMTAGRWRANSAIYQWLNVLGTSGILISLIDGWNLPAFVANVAWIMIGVASLVRIYKRTNSPLCHSREGGNPLVSSEGDSRLRGNDKTQRDEIQ